VNGYQQSKDVQKRPEHLQVQNLAMTLGIESRQAKKTLSRIKGVKDKYGGEIREILMKEVLKSVQLLPQRQKSTVKELLGISNSDENRELRNFLLQVDNLERLIDQRSAWADGKKTSGFVIRRTKQNFFAPGEYVQFDFTDEQNEKLKRVLSLRLDPDDPSSPLQFKFNLNGNQADLDEELAQLYLDVKNVLLPSQMEELLILDRWRVLNQQPFTKLVGSFGDKVRLKTAVEQHFENRYQEVLRDTVEKLRDVQERQKREVVKALPAEWQSLLDDVGK